LKYFTNKAVLTLPGYDVYFTKTADTIINHIAAAKSELKDILGSFHIPENMVIAGGGGLSKIKQSLAQGFVGKKWKKDKSLVKTTVSVPKLAYNKDFSGKIIRLDILWNNKDASFDTHLDYYEELYQREEASLCVMVTRGESLDLELPFVYERFLHNLNPFSLDNLCNQINISKLKTKDFEKIFNSSFLIKEEKIKKIAKDICSSKFGSATTHMDKLLPRIEQGSNKHCPFILIGIGKERLTKGRP